MNRLRLPIALVCPLLYTSAFAAADEPVDTSPPAPPSEEEQESLQPEINIIQREDKTIEEYRVNGQLYKIKVIPKVGPPYYLVDRNGDGSFTAVPLGGGPEPDIAIPQWVLFRW
ncbi:MAG: DUF2782 domain-containing protein [Thiogranum sp.]|jgi:hypothetical protein